jgi:hypothetical protein
MMLAQNRASTAVSERAAFPELELALEKQLF